MLQYGGHDLIPAVTNNPRPPRNPSYFLVSVSTRENLDLCMRYAQAGFPSTENGAWTYCEIANGDFVSFLYGAKAYNLYEVARREAISDAENAPPWRPLRFGDKPKTYSFPFRLSLEPRRIFTESLVRPEFSYVAENLLLRGGYRKTHFQADQTTLQAVSEMGTRPSVPPQQLTMSQHDIFTPQFTRNRDCVNVPRVCRFRETILQCAIRKHLANLENLQSLLISTGLDDGSAEGMEILSEKALPQGHVDLLLKQRVPLGSSLKIPIEVKVNRAQIGDVSQIRGYMSELASDCPLGVLVARDFRKGLDRAADEVNVRLIRYSLGADLRAPRALEEITAALMLQAV